jgi:hypothetical protein
MPVDKKALCVVCNKRRRRHVNGCCEPCSALIEAEGTHELYGIPQDKPQRRRQRELAAEYNRLIALKMTQKEIAALWGMTDRQVSNRAYRWRRAGISVSLAWGNQIAVADKPKVASAVKPKISQHGVGWGVSGCTCEPCVTSRRALRAQANRRYRKRRNMRRAQARAAASESGER